MTNENTTTQAPAAMRLPHVTMLKGLLYGIAHIQALPEDMQEETDMAEMCAYVRGYDHSQLWKLVWEVEAHIGKQIELWPAGYSYSDHDFDQRVTMRNAISTAQAKFEASKLAIDAPSSNAIRFLNGEGEEA